MLKIDYKQSIAELQQKIQCNKLIYNNTVIIGDNSTGKTTLLKGINNLGNATLISCLNEFKELKHTDIDTDIILIDNIETMLTYKNILNINTFLSEKFKNKKLVIVTHNLELVSRIENFNIVHITKHCYGIYDSNDFNTHDEVRNIITAEEDTINTILVTMLNLKLCNSWSSTEENRLKEIKKESLTKSQKLLLREIELYIN